MSSVYLADIKTCEYPSEWNPAVAYPEYIYPEFLNVESNPVYEGVRDCLYGLGYDSDHYGTAEWNPLGKFVKPGQTIIVKPNWVMHRNNGGLGGDESMQCLVTHPSIIRAVCDYCLIALGGKGRIIIGDAPMQGCDFDALMDKMRYRDVVDFYVQRGCNIVSIADFRAYETKMDKHKVIIDKVPLDGRGIDVSVGEISLHSSTGFSGYYQVSDYDKEVTTAYHHGSHHVYSINEAVLKADLFISLPKPKCHRLAGFTAAMKNTVGIAYYKEALPHRREGAVVDGGDAYLNRSYIKRAIDNTLTRKIRYEENRKFVQAHIMRYTYGLLYLLSKAICKDPFMIGSWYGNDTIWRTCLDLNYILKYANKEGIICSTPQRNLLVIGDMVVSGEHNGPVSPDPKMLGLIVASENFAAFDLAVCKIMGFPFEAIPLTRHLLSGKTWCQVSEPMIASNCEKYCGKLFGLKFPDSWKFTPHDSWREVLG